MFKIAINGRFTSQRKTGMQRFASEVIRALDEKLSGSNEFVAELLLPPDGSPIGGLSAISQRHAGMLKGHAWEQIVLPREAEGRLLVNLCASAPVFAGRQFLVIHDAAIFDNPQNYSPTYRLAYRALWWLLGRRGVTIATVSAFSAERLAARGVAVSGMIIPNGCNHINAVEADDTIFSQLPELKRGEYLLAVGNRSPNKNFGVIVDAMKKKEQVRQLLICGDWNAKVFGTADQIDGGEVVEISAVDDGALKALYSNAFAFLFPSIYEGFGIPPLEAMAMGCPVLVARSSAMPEVCANAALYFAPRSADELARAIQTLEDTPALRKQLIEKGHQRAAMFRWENSAERLLEQIRRMAAIQ